MAGIGTTFAGRCELRSIVLKTEGAGLEIKEKLQEMGGVNKAFIFGSYASGEADLRSDLDLMVIGEVDWRLVA